jgi:hypothetical protein
VEEASIESACEESNKNRTSPMWRNLSGISERNHVFSLGSKQERKTKQLRSLFLGNRS